MGSSFDDHLIARLGVRLDGQLIGHCARRDEDGSFLSKNFSNLFLKGIHRWVFTEDIIAHLCLCHGLSHGRSGLGNRITPEIDELFHVASDLLNEIRAPKIVYNFHLKVSSYNQKSSENY